MRRQSSSRVALLMLALTLFTGCHPTQPFYLHEDGDLSHYLDRATEIEYPDVHTQTLPDAAESAAPLTLTNPEFREIWDLSLEECIQISLQNSKTVRNLGGVTPFGFADGLVGRTGGAPTVYDPAIAETSRGSAFGEFNTGPLVNRVSAGQIGGVEEALADFDAQLTNSVTYARRDRPQNAAQGTREIFPQYEDQDIADVRTSIFKRSATGARYSFTNTIRGERFNNATKGFRALDSDWLTTLEARVDYPLLRGRGTQINRIPVILARINTDITLASFEASVRNSVQDIENTYWDLHLAYRNLETAKIGRDSAQVTWKIVYEKWSEGVEPVQAEAQSREQYFNFRAAVERTLQQLYTTETRLRWLMGLSPTDGRLIRPIDEPAMARVEFEWTSARTEALVRTAELNQKKWAVKQRELELISARNQLLPQLDVGLVYRWVGRGDDLLHANPSGINYPGVGSVAFEDLTAGNYQEADIQFNFFLPIGFRRQLAGVRNAQLALVREKAQLEDMELNQVHLLSTALREMDGNYVLAQTHFNRWSAAEKEVESVNALYLGGKSTLDLVLEAQRRRAQAQVDYYTALTEYNKRVAEVHFRKGSLLDYCNIQLAEGPWPQKAYWDALGRARERDAGVFMDYGWTRPGEVSRGAVPQGTLPQDMVEVGDWTIGGQPTLAPQEAMSIPEPESTEGGSSVLTPRDAERGSTVPGLLPPDARAAPVPGPVTELPGPLLNAPVIRTSHEAPVARAAGNPLRSRPFEWGGVAGDTPAVQASVPANGLRSGE